MNIKDIFDVGEIMESEEKSKSIQTLSGDDAVIIGKVLNKNKIILHMKRESDDSEGNVFVKLKEEHKDQFAVSKKLLATKNIIGLSLNEFSNFNIDEL